MKSYLVQVDPDEYTPTTENSLYKPINLSGVDHIASDTKVSIDFRAHSGRERGKVVLRGGASLEGQIFSPGIYTWAHIARGPRLTLERRIHATGRKSCRKLM